MSADRYQDAPDHVRDPLRPTPPGGWFVFETVAAAGGLAVGLTQGTPEPGLVPVVYEALSRSVAEAAARGLARWHRSRGRGCFVPDP